jgi:hypothetical protein
MAWLAFDPNAAAVQLYQFLDYIKSQPESLAAVAAGIRVLIQAFENQMFGFWTYSSPGIDN